MINIIKEEYKKILNETAIYKTKLHGRNLLYHSAPFIAFKTIIKNNQLNGNTKQTLSNGKEIYGISFTRNPEFIYGGRSSVMMIFDADKIKEKFGKRLFPFDYFFTDEFFKGKGNPDREEIVGYESEEFLINNKIRVSDFILGIKMNTHDEAYFNMGSKNQNSRGMSEVVDCFILYKNFCNNYNITPFILDNNYKDITNADLKTFDDNKEKYQNMEKKMNKRVFINKGKNLRNKNIKTFNQ